MDGKQLKNSILQWAIQGKLVPQNPKDEPAQKLLERIAAIRHSEQSEESSKRSKKTSKTPTSHIYRENGVWYELLGNAEPKDISDDIPFEIPENWAWCRLKDLASFLNGDRSKNYPNKSEYVSNGVPWINTGHITPAGYLSAETMNYIPEEKFNSLGGGFIASGDLVYCLRGATYGKIARVEPYDRGAIASSLMIIRPVVTDVREYIFLLLRTPYAKQQLNIYANGAAQPNLAAKDIEKYFIPLPPLAEQKRIVAKLEQVLPLADEYGAAQEQLDKLNKELPEALKKSILQQAIQGKLVPQNSKDEPASVLLAKIRKEKESLVKQGKLKKKDLEITPIDDDEIPFEIPDSWTWCRLGDIVSKLVDGDHNPPSGIAKKTEYMMLSSRNINFDKLVDLDNVRYLDADVFAKENERTNATIGDVLFTSVGTIGRSCVLKEDVNICFQRSVTIMTTYVYNEYLKRYFDSPFYQNYADEHAVGTAQRGFYLKEMEQSLIALPPLAEQKRIVAKLEQLFKVL